MNYNKQRLKYRASLLFGENSMDYAEKTLLNEGKNFKGSYDIFLSHSYLDSDIILVIKRDLENLGYSVYVDWTEDPQLSRSNVTKETAELIRTRLKACRTLIYAYSENSKISKWMPWELGFFDGYKSKVAVLPIEDSSNTVDLDGIEFVGIYPFISLEGYQDKVRNFYVNKNKNNKFNLKRWTSPTQPFTIVI